MKCKKGKISDPDLKCVASGPVTTSTLPIATTTLSVTTISSGMSSTTNEPLPTDSSGCSFANGYLQEIEAPKYKPICYPGFEMTEKIKQAGFLHSYDYTLSLLPVHFRFIL